MEEKYEVICIIKGNSTNAVLTLNDNEGECQIVFVAEGYNFSSGGENFFYALIELRKELELRDVKLLCKGCSRDVYPSAMILDMGDAILAYKLTMGKHALTKDLVNIFEPCELDEYATIEEQYAYYEQWINCEKQKEID